MIAAPRNRLLSALSSQSQELILKHATTLPAPIRMPLYAAEQEPQFAYFPTAGMASIVATTEDGDTAEVGIIGFEGVVGSLHLIGPAPVSTSAFIQLPGTVLRVPFTDLKKAFRDSEEIRDRILEFVQEQALVVSHIAGCNRLHEAEARLARWLLMARDRTGTDHLDFTQEFLGERL